MLQSARVAAGQSQTSLSVLFGRFVRNANISGKFRKHIVPQFSGVTNTISNKESLAKESLLLLKTLVTTSAKGVTWAMPALPVLKRLLETSMLTQSNSLFLLTLNVAFVSSEGYSCVQCLKT